MGACADGKSRIKYQISGFPREIQGVLINKCINDLVNFAKKSNDDLAYCVLGYFIMKHGGIMTNTLRKKLISASSNLIGKDKVFQEFRNDLTNYKSGELKDLGYIHPLYLFNM